MIMKKRYLIRVEYLILLLIFTNCLLAQSSKKYSEYVNPFIGTSNGGNTFPGAVVPWGMVSVSPHNSHGAPSGYIFGEKYFSGFGHTHLSGTGCADLGGIIITAIDQKDSLGFNDYKSTYKNEISLVGYYSLFIEDAKVTAEVSATERCGITKITADEETDITLLVDVGKSLNIVGGGQICIVSDDEIEGFNISGGFCGENNRQKVYFVMKFNMSSPKQKIWKENQEIEKKYESTIDTSIGYFSEFTVDKEEYLLIKVGISYVSIENARMNLSVEIPDWDFEKVKKNAKIKWDKELSKISVEGDNEDDYVKFYSALYHMLIHPNIINDVNGDYPKMGSDEIGNYKNKKRYSVFSLWDTYRTLHPFLTLVYPEVQVGMVQTMVDMFSESGFLPKWELTGQETYMMVGDPAIPVIADTYIKGLTQFEFDEAFNAMIKHTIFNENESAPPVRAGYHELLKYGYIPFEQNKNDDWWVWGTVSTTLEYCLADYSIAQFAKELGHDKYYEKFMNRSLNYKNLFDPKTQFMRPKLKNGNWLEPFDFLATEGSGDWVGSGGPGYVEGNAWNYTWFVPHDIAGLVSLFGDKEKFVTKLLRSFNEKHFTINNEPDIAYPYLFKHLSGEEYRTAGIINKIMTNEFGIGSDGLPGNDDCGTISGWFAFSALGIYPVTPGSRMYFLNEPIFDRIEIKLNPNYYEGKYLTIKKLFKGGDKTVTLNNMKIDPNFIDHSELIKGGTLIFYNKKK